jgi:hypothetical protein
MTNVGAAFGVAVSDGFLAAFDVKAAVFPGEEFGGFLGAEVFAVAEDLEEAAAEEFGEGGEAFLGHGVEASFFVEQAVRGEDVEVRVEDEDRLLKLTNAFFTRQLTPKTR